jgi:SpoVK/Ycf46/Vps4 family AAA+-type ATPase
MKAQPDSSLTELERIAAGVLGGGEDRGALAMFAGPAGSGRRAAAQSIADRLARELLAVDLSEVVSKYIGETEKNLSRLFDAAEASGAILLFDEGDALFGKGDETQGSDDRDANRVIGLLLEQADSRPVVAIVATRDPERLDPKLLRRARFEIDFPRPPKGADAAR